jgi:HNH endonuclease
VRPLPLPDREYVREALDYDPITGVFLWRIRPETHFAHAMSHRLWNAKWAGKIAGNVKPHGYRIILLASQPYLAHRLAWLLVHGKAVKAPAQIDHINGDQSDNRIGNLRIASPANNSANAKTRDNTSGVKGVGLLKTGRRRYKAYITRNYRQHYLGVFTTLEEAAAARRDAEQMLHGEFTRKVETDR